MISKHHGRIIKLMGDGVLVEFGSAVNAVNCAVELQTAMDIANADVGADQRIVLRAGINLGDVMVEGSDLYGDGVNIAARLESLSEPGGLCISGSVFEHVNGKLPHSFVSLGPQTLKNIDSRAPRSFATREAFSDCATAPRICRTMTAVGVSW